MAARAPGRPNIVVFTSDNGPEYPVNSMESRGRWDDPIRDRCFGTPGSLRGMKRFTYEGGHRVPGIVRWPGRVPGGTVSDALINGTGLLPTLSGMAGIPAPADRTIDGEDVLPALRGEPFERSRPVVWSAPVHEYDFVPPLTMREGDLVLVAWFGEKEASTWWSLGQGWREKGRLISAGSPASRCRRLRTPRPR
jgi:arylsulfatase A